MVQFLHVTVPRYEEITERIDRILSTKSSPYTNKAKQDKHSLLTNQLIQKHTQWLAKK